MSSMYVRVLALVLIAQCPACFLFSPRPSLDQLPWTPGRATQGMVERVRGTVLDGMPWESDELHSFPDETSRPLDFPDGNVTVSGPDVDGCIAMLRTNAVFASDRLELIRSDGSRQHLSKWSSMDPWPAVALSERGQRIAVSFRVDRGGYDYTDRVIRIFDVPSGTTRTIDSEPVGHLVWVLDGGALAFVVYSYRGADGLWHPGFNGEPFDPHAPRIERKQTVMLYSFDSGETRELCTGEAVAAANTPDRLLVVHDLSVQSVDVRTGDSIEYGRVPGMGSSWLLGQTPEELLVYEGWATREEGVEFPCFTTMAPSHTWTVKAFDPKSQEFCTLVPRVYHGRRDYRLPRAVE